MIVGVTVNDIRGRDLDRLGLLQAAPKADRDEARSLLRPPVLARFCPSARAIRIQFDPPRGRLPTNPSICRHRGELQCVIRTLNYRLLPERKWVVDDPDGIVRTVNYLGRLRLNGEFVEPKPMRDLDPTPKQPSKISGYEDVRIVSIKGTLTGSATVCDRDLDERRRIVRLHLTASGNVKRADVQLTYQAHEKNWMPLSVGGEFAWIYSIDPTAILPGPLRSCPFALDHLRGGAAIEYGDGYLCVMHEVIDTDSSRIYLHRFVRLDKRFNVTAVSPAWVFARHGIEFCAGIAYNKGEIVLSYGVEDREAWIMRINAKEIEDMKWNTP